jgi:hypothetical protein
MSNASEERFLIDRGTDAKRASRRRLTLCLMRNHRRNRTAV